MSHRSLEQQPQSVAWAEPILDTAIALVRHWRWLGAILVMGVSAGAFVAFRSADWYQAGVVAHLMPRERPVIDFSIRSGAVEATDSSAERAESGSLMLPPTPDLYVEMLTSDEVLGPIAARFAEPLTQALELERDELVEAIRDRIAIASSETGLLTVEVRAPTPALAADLANALLAEGEKTSKSLERQLVEQQIRPLEVAIGAARDELSEAEAELATFHRNHRISRPQHETSELLRQMRELGTRGDQLERDLAARRQTHAEADYQIEQLKAQIAVGQERIARIREAVAGAEGSVGYGDLVVRHDRLELNVRRHSDLLRALETQLDVFRVRASQPSGSLAVVRRAVPPTKVGGPRRKRTLLGFVLGSVVVGVIVALLLEHWSRARRDPGCVSRIDDLRALVRPVRTRAS